MSSSSATPTPSSSAVPSSSSSTASEGSDTGALYDVVIVGAGIAGSAMAYALGRQGRRVALVERSFEEPDRIVGELLQPGGVRALTTLGLRSTLDNIDAISVEGYCVIYNGRPAQIPYPAPPPGAPATPSGHEEGRSFHHGRFVQSLRAAARSCPSVTCIEATVKSLVYAPGSREREVLGVRLADEREVAGNLTVVADGCFSNLRKAALVDAAQAETRSHFVGLILKDADLPMPRHGHVLLGDEHACVLIYQIGQHDTRILVDVRGPRPAGGEKLKNHILTHTLPHLPASVHPSLRAALDDPAQRLRIMPNSYLPPKAQAERGQKKGVLVLGDAFNMRHPLTGGGMTCALTDVALLSGLLHTTSTPSLSDWSAVSAQLQRWQYDRRGTAGTVNTLSMALYDLFSGDQEELIVLREGCFNYFLLGGECVSGPVGLLSALTPRPLILFYHFFAVALFSISRLFKTSKTSFPSTILRALSVFWVACFVLLPVMWGELGPVPPRLTPARTALAGALVLAAGAALVARRGDEAVGQWAWEKVASASGRA